MKKSTGMNVEQFIQNSSVQPGCLCGNCCAVCICAYSNSGSGNADATADRAEGTSTGLVPSLPIIGIRDHEIIFMP